jgi:hypothetical protein
MRTVTYPSRAEAMAAEARAIIEEKPLWNIMGVPKPPKEWTPARERAAIRAIHDAEMTLSNLILAGGRTRSTPEDEYLMFTLSQTMDYEYPKYESWNPRKCEFSGPNGNIVVAYPYELYAPPDGRGGRAASFVVLRVLNGRVLAEKLGVPYATAFGSMGTIEEAVQQYCAWTDDPPQEMPSIEGCTKIEICHSKKKFVPNQGAA